MSAEILIKDVKRLSEYDNDCYYMKFITFESGPHIGKICLLTEEPNDEKASYILFNNSGAEDVILVTKTDFYDRKPILLEMEHLTCSKVYE